MYLLDCIASYVSVYFSDSIAPYIEVYFSYHSVGWWGVFIDCSAGKKCIFLSVFLLLVFLLLVFLPVYFYYWYYSVVERIYRFLVERRGENYVASSDLMSLLHLGERASQRLKTKYICPNC